ncbi:MAG: vitamin K epoxide reductase family protein [Homoserinimonas sp.]|nr:vitamin K epoxide reductase family protein [Cryobacterium sp.]MCO5293290.1 vitamin K epoxide reductase family protein [Homoserinimonas sp.]MCW5944686.1 vitamin K epoxide reductase family protein [Cryobacterium sp.]
METARATRPLGLAISLIVFAAIGTYAAFSLVMDKIELLEHPNTSLNCDLSVLVACSTNLNSVQGQIFGFPNPVLGLIFWPAVGVVGVAILAGAKFAGWFWALFSLAVTGAFALVAWFVTESIFTLRVLCPWCMVTWLVTIPLFFLVVLYTFGRSALPLPTQVRSFSNRLFSWVPLLSLVCYLVIAVLAQWQLDVLNNL